MGPCVPVAGELMRRPHAKQSGATIAAPTGERRCIKYRRRELLGALGQCIVAAAHIREQIRPLTSPKGASGEPS
ncbi:unnamed protein product [Urochloa humidicola]